MSMTTLMTTRRGARGWLTWALLAGLAAGCSVRKMAVNQLGNALAGGGTTFASDEDPELVKAAVPFSLKLMEALLAESPRHEGLLLSAAGGFTQFSYAFVHQEADETEAKDLQAAEALRTRARKLYLRARNYGLRGLEVRHPGFGGKVRQDPKGTVRGTVAGDVPLLYWTAAAWAAAISVSKNDPELIADQVVIEAMMDRALELDDRFGDGAIHGFLINYELVRKGVPGDALERARRHFEAAVSLSGGDQAGPFVTYAEAVCIQQQDLANFKRLLQRALEVKVDAKPEWRLVNLVMQRRARWLLSRTEELFVETEPPAEKTKQVP